MKKILLSLIPMMALLLLGSLPVKASMPVNEDGDVFTDPGKNVKITLVSAGEYVVEAINTDQDINFDNLPDGPAERDFINAFKAGTKITLKGTFSNLNALNSTNKQWLEANMKDMVFNETGGYWDAEQNQWVTVVGASVPTIKDAFGQGVETLILPDALTSLNKDKFNDLNAIKNVTFGANLLSIPKELFKGKSTLETVVFGSSLETIEESAFAYCTSLNNVTFPESLKEIGVKAFQGCRSFTVVDLDLPNLEAVYRNAFDMDDNKDNPVNKLETIILPQDNTKLTKFGNNVFCMVAAKIIDFSGCKGIVNFLDEDSYGTFNWLCFTEEVILPPNLARVGKECFKNCPMLKKVTFTGEAVVEDGVLTNPITIGPKAFYQELGSQLETVEFSNNLTLIDEYAFSGTHLTEVLLDHCHFLNRIKAHAFEKIDELLSVKICSHPKVLEGPHGTGAFNNCKNIETVEVVGCADVTDITQCKCEAGAFDFDRTNVQTQLESVEKAARLIFPRDLPAGNTDGYENPYTSAFDFFVGDYKAGVAISQSNLQVFYKTVPNEGHGYGQPVNQPELPATVGDTRYDGNGWLEFINTGDGIVINPDEGKFLRTYSRTEDSGPVLLPSTITAYRAIDYASTLDDYVGKKNGEYVNVNEYETDAEPDYQVYANMSADDKVTYKKYPRYSILTVRGELLLRALRPIKQRMNTETGTVENYFDETVSYVPENTGVVLYSTNISEDAFLVFDAYTENDYLFPEYPHTGTDRNEADRLEKGGTVGDLSNADEELRDDINMLQGSYGSEHKVAPVLPWNWDKNTYYKNNMQYRNFGFNKSLNKWRRLTPGVLRLNRAWAMIPIGRFDNHNETSDQMPEFTLEDHVSNNSNTILVFGSSFEDDEVDGIRTISTSAESYEKDAWYTLQGVRVDNPTKGVYIHNNKKVVIK